ncbi:MAG: PQQ-binding-like beta-propeller repeat protein, partial [Planctomycetes bacterium]|nr:PQQ-binding-like beta-propeller repeat protein [Planctomycetota bacterium]
MKFAHGLVALSAYSFILVTAGCSDSVAVFDKDDDSPSAVNGRNQQVNDITSPEEVVAFQISAERNPAGQREAVSLEVVEDAGDARRTPRREATTTNQRFDWPHWRGPNRNGISSETGLIHEFPANGPKILWREKLSSGFSGLSVSGGRVFTLFGEGGREKVVCFDANTGREIWKIDSDADFVQGRSYGPRSTPCVDGNRLFAVGASGRILCLDTATGKTIWSFNLY